MKTIKNGKPHEFLKKNLVTQIDRKGTYDILVCSKCGISGKARTLGTVEIKDSYSDEKAENCTIKKQKFGSVKVTGSYVCLNFGLVLNKTYDRCECPEEYKDKHSDAVWVFSETRNEPIRLLPDEFEIINS